MPATATVQAPTIDMAARAAARDAESTAKYATVPRAVLVDRLAGLLLEGSDASGLQERLDAILDDLVVGVSRRDLSGIPDDSEVHSAMEKAIYDALLDGIEIERLAVPEELTKYGRVIADDFVRSVTA
jgi:Asp-tRNA(Asn)/Glu-tRNA(Gln) amidotransferase A subunit family amidase